jgi:hypothetical protein
VNDDDSMTIEVSPGPPGDTAGERRIPAARRLAATALLAIGLLGVGGVAIVSAADPTPTPSSSTTTTQTPSTSSGTSTPRSGHTGANCPNMNGKSSTNTPTSNPSSSP